MILRIDKLPVELPASTKVDPASAASVQELLGGRMPELANISEAFAPEYKAEEIYEIASKLWKKAK